MSISREHGESLKNEMAVVCCRTEKGAVIDYCNLEDPEIFEDMTEAGLLDIPHNCLKIEQVIGKKLLKTVDSLTPLTRDMFDSIDKENDIDIKAKAVLKVHKKKGHIIKINDMVSPMYFDDLQDSLLIKLSDDVLNIEDVLGKAISCDIEALTCITSNMIEGYDKCFNEEKNEISEDNGILKIKIGEGKDIDIEIPLNIYRGSIEEIKRGVEKSENYNYVRKSDGLEKSKSLKCVKSVEHKHFKIEHVIFGEKTEIDGTTLYIRRDICKDALKESSIIKSIDLDIITPDMYGTYSDTIMDVQPIAAKEDGAKIGTGITRVIDGAVVIVTGTDEDGVQIGEFGSSEGILEENIMWNRPGSPDRGDILIKTKAVITRGMNMERPGPFAAHKASDYITQEIRQALKDADEKMVVKREKIAHYRRPGKKKVVIVKEIMGQGAMHDNLILPIEPVGVLGGKPNVDLGNLPVMLSPVEVLDGGIHALTCIGPASKECSRHYFREPLIIEAMNDEDIDLAGVIFVGSPQINSEKFYVSERLGMMIEAMDVDGAIVTTEGFGNNHIDFASHIEQIGMRGIPAVGMSFCAVQGALVVGNKYMKYMIDNNKSEEGVENEILACNTLCREDAVRAVEMLKAIMNGEDIKPAERKWNEKVKSNNISIIKNSGIEI